MVLSNLNPKFFNSTPLQSAFLKDAKKYEVLKADEERELTRQYYEEKSIEARDRLMLSNQLFVYSLAKRYARDEDEIMDYVQEGNIGLSIAIENFKPEEGKRLLTIGRLYIQRSMNYYLNNIRDAVHRPNAVKMGHKVERFRQSFYVQNGYLPTDETLMEMVNDVLDLGLTDINDVRDIRIASISEEIGDDYTVEENVEYNEITSVENGYVEVEEVDSRKQQAYEALATLPEKATKTKEIIMKMFGIGYERPYSMDEICHEYNMDPPMVNQVRNAGLEYMRQNYKHNRAVI